MQNAHRFFVRGFMMSGVGDLKKQMEAFHVGVWILQYKMVKVKIMLAKGFGWREVATALGCSSPNGKTSGGGGKGGWRNEVEGGKQVGE